MRPLVILIGDFTDKIEQFDNLELKTVFFEGRGEELLEECEQNPGCHILLRRASLSQLEVKKYLPFLALCHIAYNQRIIMVVDQQDHPDYGFLILVNEKVFDNFSFWQIS
jgi:hypothetical protein